MSNIADSLSVGEANPKECAMCDRNGHCRLSEIKRIQKEKPPRKKLIILFLPLKITAKILNGQCPQKTGQVFSLQYFLIPRFSGFALH